jgi:hypothetical protein
MATAAVKELVGMPTLPITKNLMSKISETPTPGGYIGPKETLGSEQELLAQKGQATEDLTKADIGVEKAKREEEASKLDIDAQSKRELVESIRGLPEKTALDEKNEQFKNLAFVPTKDTVQDIAGLFSLINVIGMAIGGGGKQNAQMAMHAMNGMAEGYQKGRSDLYRKEQIQFDKNFKAMQAAVQTLEKDYTRAVELEKTNKEAGRIERQVALARQNSPVLKALEDRAGVARTLEVIKDLAKSKDTAVERFNSLKKIEEDKLAKQRQQEEERRAKERQFDLAERRLQLLENKQLGGKQLKDKDVSKIEGAESLANSLEKLKKDFKPEYASLGFLGVGADLSYEAKRRLGSEEGQKAVSWWSQYERLQAPERHSLFGATLTGNELKSYQGMSAKKSDNPKVVENMLQDQINYSRNLADDRKIAFETAGYKVPESIKPRDFIRTYESGSTEQTQAQAPSVDIDKERSTAKAAIAAGKDEEAVKRRYKERTGQEL